MIDVYRLGDTTILVPEGVPVEFIEFEPAFPAIPRPRRVRHDEPDPTHRAAAGELHIPASLCLPEHLWEGEGIEVSGIGEIDPSLVPKIVIDEDR